MAVVNKFNVNKQQVTLDADIIENMSANDVSYDASTQYDENTVGDKLSELSEEIGIVKGHYTGTNTFIFDKSQIAAGSKIKVSFVLYHPTGKVAVYDADDKELKGFYITNGTIGQNYTFDSYVLPENYESVKIARWGDLDVEIRVESLNPKCIAQSFAELESQVSELDKQVIYDVTANNDGITLDSLSVLLSSENLSTLIPITVRCGGMSISFVQSSDNKYVQYLFNSTRSTINDFTNLSNWEKINLEEELCRMDDRMGYPISVTTVKEYNFVKLVKPIPQGTKIKVIDVVPSNAAIFGRTNINTPTQRLFEETITDIDVNYIGTSLPATITLICEGLYYYSRVEPLPSQRIEDSAVTCAKADFDIISSIDDSIGYKNTIMELYLIAPIPNDSDLCIKYTGKSLYFRARQGNLLAEGTWDTIVDISTWENNKVYPLLCTTASDSLGVNVGDIVAYIIFKDITAFKAVQSYGLGNIIYEKWVRDISNSPIIAQYIRGVEIPNSAITTEKIANGAITQEKLANDVSSNENGIEIILPNEVIAVEGDTLQIFHRSVIRCVNPYAYHIEIICSVGKNYPRYFTYTPDSSHIGNTYTLTYRVRRNDEIIIAQKQTYLRVIEKLKSPLTNKNILVIGASTYENGNIVNEVRRRLTLTTGSNTPSNPTGLGLSNITFIGRKNISTLNINLEATGGYGWKSYSTNVIKSYRFYVSDVNQLNIGDTYTIQGFAESETFHLIIGEINIISGEGNIRCDTYGGASYSNPVPNSGALIRKSGTGDSSISYSSVEQVSGNPFWNTQAGAIDFQNYSAQYCGGVSIDAIISQMGINDINNIDLTALFTNYIKPFIRKYHADYPDGKFFIGGLQLPSCTGGMGANYGASGTYNYYTQANKCWDFLKAVYELVSESEFSSYVHFMATTEEFDCENCYPFAATNVNNRVNITENLGTNGVHPTNDGGKMLSDAIYRALSYSL